MKTYCELPKTTEGSHLRLAVGYELGRLRIRDRVQVEQSNLNITRKELLKEEHNWNVLGA